MAKKRIAIIGAGISGLGCAYRLRQHPDFEITIYESGKHIGGHSNTVDITLDTPSGPVQYGVDTGFLVFNRRTYPRLVRLFEELAVPIFPSEMSFSVKLESTSPLEWAGNDLNSFFGQRRNLLRPSFWKMARDIMRFNALATRLALSQESGDTRLTKTSSQEESIADFLDRHAFGKPFRDWYFLPMIGAIWSCSVDQMLEFPIQTMARFCHNHGLLKIQDRPQWLTVQGGSREYVKRLVSALDQHGVHWVREAVTAVHIANHGKQQAIEVISANGAAQFDEIVMACHSDQSLDLLHGIDSASQSILSAIPYQANRAILHTDASFLPERKRCWAAWNYTAQAKSDDVAEDTVSVSYLINLLQPLPPALKDIPIIVTLNPLREPDPSKIFQEIRYAHPVFDMRATDAQADLALIQGKSSVWYCGAWTGYGFHEDGLRSGETVAEAILERSKHPASIPTSPTEVNVAN
ncbi:MAG: FAD-dependent oxidoreductase [Polynucleobacter sp.]|nr:FAD-dependent oxidoreductase [Polynucleobacter sp.]